MAVGKEIAKDWSDLEFSADNVDLAIAAVSQAQEDLRLMQRRMAVGRSIQVEVQDAALALKQAQLNQVTAIYRHQVNKAELMRSAGLVKPK